MSYLPQVSDERNLPAFQLIEKDFGFVPNFYRAQGIRPDLVDAQVHLVDAILIRKSTLTRRQKEYVFLVCSAANLSTYCVTAHCEIVRMLGVEGTEPEQIAVDYTAANLPIAMKALLSFATKLNGRPTKVSRRDINALHTYGYTDEQILETVLIVSLAKFANSVAFGLGTVPDFDPPEVVLRMAEAGGSTVG